MLKSRIITAVVLFALLLAVLYSGSPLLFSIAVTVFLAVASWESQRLFGSKRPWLGATLWTIVFVGALLSSNASEALLLFACCVAIWAVRFTPALKLGLPAFNTAGNLLVNGVYGLAILGCFIAITVLFNRDRGPLYLVSVMAIVWVADIGAYFVGKAFGRRKLAPAISPGKSWEGAAGGWISVLLFAGLSTLPAAGSDTFAAHVAYQWGWVGLVIVMTLFVAASIVGDLFESLLKRRAGMKDSGTLLPGHGGLLDRIDALIPTLPMAALLGYWL